jgi:hypothetical protein
MKIQVRIAKRKNHTVKGKAEAISRYIHSIATPFPMNLT